MGNPTGIEAASLGGLQPVAFSVKQKLELERVQLVKRLSDVDDALTIIKKNPDIERLMSIMSGRIY